MTREEAVARIKDHVEIHRCHERNAVKIFEALEQLPSVQPAPCEFCKHNNIADDKACLMCSAERRTDG